MEAYSVVSIVCPQCGTELKPAVDVCHHCGANTSSETEKGETPRSRLIDRPWLLVVVVLHVGVLGIPLYWKTNYSTPVRLAIIAASIVYTVFAVTVIAWGCMLIVNLFRQLG